MIKGKDHRDLFEQIFIKGVNFPHIFISILIEDESMLEQAFIIAFIVYFIKATTWKGMIFYDIKEKLTNLPSYIRKPFFECPVCMTPWWGVVVYLVAHYSGLHEFHELTIARLIFTVLISSGINTVILIINKIYDKINQVEHDINGKV